MAENQAPPTPKKPPAAASGQRKFEPSTIVPKAIKALGIEVDWVDEKDTGLTLTLRHYLPQSGLSRFMKAAFKGFCQQFGLTESKWTLRQWHLVRGHFLKRPTR